MPPYIKPLCFIYVCGLQQRFIKFTLFMTFQIRNIHYVTEEIHNNLWIIMSLCQDRRVWTSNVLGYEDQSKRPDVLLDRHPDVCGHECLCGEWEPLLEGGLCTLIMGRGPFTSALGFSVPTSWSLKIQTPLSVVCLSGPERSFGIFLRSHLFQC